MLIPLTSIILHHSRDQIKTRNYSYKNILRVFSKAFATSKCVRFFVEITWKGTYE